MTEARTIGDLKSCGYVVLPVREEIRRNLIKRLQHSEEVFPGIIGYQETVLPQLENAILSGQDILLLGERGQAKSRIIRSLVALLDEYIPVLQGVEIPENPLAPV
ncbi:MAG: magnesium chelatase, partial [Gammaproteobacteria bacterium]|nr:magnesium chelatase [Gammaproteobacteria bacterium]